MRYRFRELSNGMYVAEVRKWWWLRWRALDWHTLGCAWPAGSRFYKDCWNKKLEDAESLLRNYEALNGL